MVGEKAPTILVVEDQPMLRERYTDSLRTVPYEVEQASNATEAIRSLDRRRPPADRLRVVLLAMTLPGTEGVEVLQHLAELGGYVPVVTVGACTEQLAAATAAGARETLAEPIELADLLSTVARHCPRSRLTSVGPRVEHALDRLAAAADALQAELARLEASPRDAVLSGPGRRHAPRSEPQRVLERRT
jgi:DNA-binding NtrC family response regulator